MRNSKYITKKLAIIFAILISLTCTEIYGQTEDSVTSIIGKVLAGYQGWFNSDSDGSDLDWKHYKTAAGDFEPGKAAVDFWPDMSEADADEKYATSFNHIDGSVATVFSSANTKTVNRHFKWMNDYNIDGVFVQRFASNLKSNAPKLKANNNVVFDNCIAGAKANNDRLISIMYDLSGANGTSTMVNDIKQDWQELVTKHGLNDNTNTHLLTYKQKPIVALWGVGFSRSDNYSLDDVQELINYFKNDATYGGCTVLLGVPRGWRTLNGDATTDTQLHDVIKSADIVHPWTVGRYSNLSQADTHKSIIAEDKSWCDTENLLYMPVVFPGFSWQNLKKSQGTASDLNSTPRLKGDFLWRQFYNAIDEGAQTIYVAMFDEMDEGTCIFKVDDNPPSGASQFTNYEGLPNDYYLWLTGKARETLQNDLALSATKPAYPGLVLPDKYYVTGNGDDSNTGTTLGTAFKTIQKAHDFSSSGNKIFISGDITQNSKVQITKTISFEGLSNATLSPNEDRVGFDRMFEISTSNLTVSFTDLIFLDNVNTSVAGGVLSLTSNSILNITNSLFQGNSSTLNGGALYATAGTLNVLNDTFYNNTGNNGGGIFVTGANTVANVTNSTFFQNKILNTDKNFGAAIRVENNATATLTNSLAWDNKANSGSGNESGFNSSENGITTAVNSVISDANNTDTNTDSNLAVNLTNSNLTFNVTLNKVTFTAPNALTDGTPIDFGNDTKDVGAWDSKINIFKATTDNFWNDGTNWSNGALPLSTDNVAILNGEEVTLNTDATIVDLKLTNNLKINAGQSLIVTGTVTGDANKVFYKRNLSHIAADAEGWHLVAASVSGQTYNNTYADDESLATSSTNATRRGLGFYSTADRNFSYLLTDDSNAGTFESGRGYIMKRASAGQVKFIGDLNTNDAGVAIAISTADQGFNLLGNPYTSFINSKTFLEDGVNATNLMQQIWVWNQTGGGNYEVKMATDGSPFMVATGQGFFVKATSGTSTNFAESNQTTNADTFLKTARTEINLLMNDGVNYRFAKLNYLDNVTAGFDKGWEGETFGGASNNVDVFTHLVADSQGKNYQVQALPKAGLEAMVVPVGVRGEAGKEVTFSLETVNLPSDVKVYLEDRAANTFNEIDENTTFKVTLTEALEGIGRFYLHTSRSALSIDDVALDNVSIYKSGKSTLTMAGLTQGKSTVKIFNILGKQLLNKTFVSNGVQDIKLPKIATGVYIVQLETEKGKLNKKIILEYAR